MEKTSINFVKFLVFVFLTVVLPFHVPAQAQETDPFPVDIEINTIVGTDQTVTINISVTPGRDIIAQVSCLFPDEVNPVENKDIIVFSYSEGILSAQKKKTGYSRAATLWLGPLKEGVKREFSVRALLADKNKHEIAVRVKVLGGKGTVEKPFIIDLD